MTITGNTPSVLPEGCKGTKLNLPDAYRTTATRIVVGDVVRVHYGARVIDEVEARDTGIVLLSGTAAPSRSFWARVESIDGSRQMMLVDGHRTVPLVAHEGITRQARRGEPLAVPRVDVTGTVLASLAGLTVVDVTAVDAVTADDAPLADWETELLAMSADRPLVDLPPVTELDRMYAGEDDDMPACDGCGVRDGHGDACPLDLCGECGSDNLTPHVTGCPVLAEHGYSSVPAVAGEGRSDLVAAPIKPMVLTRRKTSKGRGSRGW